MAQIFHRSTNTISRVSLFSALFLAGLALVFAGAVARSPYMTNANIAREQPVQFSHNHRVGQGAPAAGLRLFQSQHPREQGRRLRHVPRASEPDAAGLSSFLAADGVVPRLPPQPGAIPEAARASVQHGLEAACGPDRAGAAAKKGIQHSQRRRANELLDVPPLMPNREFGMKMPDHEHDENEDLAPREHPLDLAAARERLSSRSGKEFWRSLEELSRDAHFEELLHREFPRHAAEWSETDGVGRRDFLKLMAASLALAGISGCARTPNETILPYVKSPEGLTLGKPLYFSTAMPMGTTSLGLLVESHEGRPTKIEGNPDHPGSLGATDVFAQAAVLGLYDPDRSQSVSFREKARTWNELIEELRARLGPNTEQALDARVAILTEAIGSPTLDAQL